jgi:hypothetical protein
VCGKNQYLAALKAEVDQALENLNRSAFYRDPEEQARLLVEVDAARMQVILYERYGIVQSKRRRAEVLRRGIALEMKNYE